MPAAPRKRYEVSEQLVPLLVLGFGLIASRNYVTIIDDEATIVSDAAAPLRTTLAAFFSGAGLHEHPPLYDILLHYWLQWTGGNFDELRIPSVLFFLAGLYLLARACRHFTEPGTGVAIIWLGVLWPFGFFFGRLAAWYAFSFFLVSGLTLAYLKYLEQATPARQTVLFLFAAALIWTNYFGWALLLSLIVDQFLRRRSKEAAASPKALAATAALLFVTFVPLLRPFRAELARGIHLHGRFAAIFANGAFNVFSLFVSESVAPWYWWLSIPLGLVILACIGLVAWSLERPVRRFLYYSAALIALMAVLGILQTKYLLTLAPWVLLPIGAAIESEKPRWAGLGLAVALLLIGLGGWYGIYTRRYYSAPRFIEPWQEVSGEMADKIGSGETVIADHPSFLFYLTYALHVPSQNGPWRFEGSLPDAVTHPQVYSSLSWIAAKRPAAGKIVLVRGGRDPGGNGPIDAVQRTLDQSCGSISSRLRMRDEGYVWKQRFFPQLGEPQWRVEIREYDCDAANSSRPSLPPS